MFAAYTVPDATVDPFRITLENVNHARQLTQSVFLSHTELERFVVDGGTIRSAICRDTRSGETTTIHARQVVNAAGAWAMRVARLAGCSGVKLLYSKGSLIISNARIGRRVINRLRPPGDGDILVPGGTVSLLGTTSETVQDLDEIHPTVAEVDRLVAEGIAMVPQIAHTRFIRAFSGVRPLLMAAGADADGRKASRGFSLFDHESEGLANFATVAGGKLTTFRLMAEKTGDLVARRLGNSQPCKTATAPLPSGDAIRWTEPGFAARYWVARRAAGRPDSVRMRNGARFGDRRHRRERAGRGIADEPQRDRRSQPRGQGHLPGCVLQPAGDVAPVRPAGVRLARGAAQHARLRGPALQGRRAGGLGRASAAAGAGRGAALRAARPGPTR